MLFCIILWIVDWKTFHEYIDFETWHIWNYGLCSTLEIPFYVKIPCHWLRLIEQ